MLAHRKDVQVPEVFVGMTSSRVLTMEFCPGTPLTDVDSLRKSGVHLAKVCLAFCFTQSLHLKRDLTVSGLESPFRLMQILS